jgi:glucose-1-phosphate cytidylyltransferase
MIEIGGKPILWHIMKLYSAHGVNDFVICCGYKGYMIKEYFANYFLHMSDVTFDMRHNTMEVHQHKASRGASPSSTPARHDDRRPLKRVRDYVATRRLLLHLRRWRGDVDIGALIAFHAAHGKLATVTAVLPPGRYGALSGTATGEGIHREAARRRRPDQRRVLRIVPGVSWI